MTKIIFPAIYSSLDPKAILTRILSHYLIESVRYCQFWDRGLSDIYMLKTDGKSYILRISHHHWRKRVDIEFELQLEISTPNKVIVWDLLLLKFIN